jgi:outer membrane protein OmpA-like peptidoglycan-associated protein
LPPQSPSEVEIPAAAPPQVTAELRSRGEEAASGASGLENLAPEPQDAAPATLPPQAPGEIEIPAITPPPPAAASPDPESEVPGAATGSDAPPPAAQILGELAEAAEREAPRTRKVIAPPVPEPPPPLVPDADKSDETATADELAPTPSAPEPEERLGPAPSPSTAGDPKRQLAARPPAKAPLEGRILFEAGSTELSPEARGVLEGLAESLKAADAEGVELRAYATGRDSRRLSLSRGLVARGYLEKLGVEADKVFLRPLGDKATDGPSERIDFELVTP